jgi:hypothetical protein
MFWNSNTFSQMEKNYEKTNFSIIKWILILWVEVSQVFQITNLVQIEHLKSLNTNINRIYKYIYIIHIWILNTLFTLYIIPFIKSLSALCNSPKTFVACGHILQWGT